MAPITGAPPDASGQPHYIEALLLADKDVLKAVKDALDEQASEGRASQRSIGDKKESDVADLSAVLLAQAQVLDGEVPPDSAAFARRLIDLIVRGLG